MDNSQKPEIPLELFEQLFPWPEDMPLPRPRFGNVTEKRCDRLRDPKFIHGGEPISALAFLLRWQSDDLGLEVCVQEEFGKDKGQLSVTAFSDRLEEHEGKQVKVVLIGKAGDEDELQMLVTVDLDTERVDPLDPSEKKRIGWSGRKLLGTPAQLRDQLGDGEISLDAFLLI